MASNLLHNGKKEMPAPKNKNVTIVDVAHESGVSYSTVSRVLNGYQFVKESTRQRVLEAADKLGYVANQQARSLAGGQSNIIGLLVPGLDLGYVGMIARGIDEALAATPYDLMLYTTHRRKGKEASFARMIANGLSDGLLLVAPSDVEDYIDTLHSLNFPYVLVDQDDPSERSSIIESDNWQGAYDATQYLIDLGHQRIAHIVGLPMMTAAQQRLTGYKAALEHNNIPYDENLVEDGGYWQRGGAEAAKKLLTLDQPPTAIFAANDYMAFGVMDVAHHRGIRIPDDLSLIGFDDVLQAEFSNPKLSTVRQPLYDMGQSAIQLLLERINKPTSEPERIVLKTEFIQRESCAPPLST